MPLPIIVYLLPLVIDVPDIIAAALSYEVVENGNVTILYTVGSYPVVTELPTLERMDGGQMPASFITADSVTLVNIQHVHAGTYSLVSTNSAGSGSGSFEIIILCE